MRQSGVTVEGVDLVAADPDAAVPDLCRAERTRVAGGLDHGQRGHGTDLNDEDVLPIQVVGPPPGPNTALAHKHSCADESLGSSACWPEKRPIEMVAVAHESGRDLQEPWVRDDLLACALGADHAVQHRTDHRRLSGGIVEAHAYFLSVGDYKNLSAWKETKESLSPMADDLSTGEAAERLSTTPPTIRAMLLRGELTGHREDRGRRLWRVDASSVDRHIELHGRFSGTRRPSRLAEIERELAVLRAAVAGAGSIDKEAKRERDDLRATVVMLRESVARMQTVAQLQTEADRERAAVVEHLLAAVSAGERADGFRSKSLTELQEAVAAASRPGHVGDLGAEGTPG